MFTVDEKWEMEKLRDRSRHPTIKRDAISRSTRRCWPLLHNCRRCAGTPQDLEPITPGDGVMDLKSSDVTS